MINIWHFILFNFNINLNWRLFIKCCHRLFAVLIYGLKHMNVVHPERLTLDNSKVVLVLRNDSVLEELPGESVAECLLERQVDEVATLLVHDIMVTDHLTTLLLLGDGDGALVVFATPVSVTKTDETLGDEIHLRNFYVLIVNNTIYGV